MSVIFGSTASSATALKQIWFTRSPVPTATGLAYKLGWLDEEFARDGIHIATLQDAPLELSRHHYDHELPELIREGGSLLALAARAQGAPTRLIGLTWIDEWQVILVRPNSGISEPADLKGLRLALPAFSDRDIRAHTRGCSTTRGMSLQGYKGALAMAGLSLDDVKLVEVPSGCSEPIHTQTGPQLRWAGLEYLADGRVDGVYVKGASAVAAAKRFGATVGIALDSFPDRRFRVNNGTPRPITVHESLLDNHFDIVVRFLEQTLRAADWAANNPDGLYEVLQRETGAGSEDVSTAYRYGFHLFLHPDLSPERLDLLRIQKDFMLIHGFLDRDFDLHAWVDRRPLEAAQQRLAARKFAA